MLRSLICLLTISITSTAIAQVDIPIERKVLTLAEVEAMAKKNEADIRVNEANIGSNMRSIESLDERVQSLEGSSREELISTIDGLKTAVEELVAPLPEPEKPKIAVATSDEPLWDGIPKSEWLKLHPMAQEVSLVESTAPMVGYSLDSQPVALPPASNASISTDLCPDCLPRSTGAVCVPGEPCYQSSTPVPSDIQQEPSQRQRLFFPNTRRNNGSGGFFRRN